MFSLFWFVLYLMNRLIQVKNDVQLSTPRGFYTTVRNSSDNSFLFSTSTSSLSTSSSSISNYKSTQPTLTITLDDGNVLDAFKTMNFHRSKMNEYLCDDFITTAKIAPIFEQVLDSDSDINSRNIAAKLIHDVGSNSYKTWLMRTVSNGNKPQQRNSTQRQDLVQFGYAKGRFKKPFYKLGSTSGSINSLRNSNNYDDNIEEEDIHFGMSFPAYHENHYKESSYPIYEPIQKRTSAIPITLSVTQRHKHPTQLIPNENIIGVNLHGRYLNLTENSRKNLKNNGTLLDTFQRSDLPQNHLGQSSNKETIAIYVTQSNPPPLRQQMIMEGNMYWTSDNNAEISNYNAWPTYPDNDDNMQRSPQIPPPDTNNKADSFGTYSYTTIPTPSMDNNVAPYTQYYPSITDSSKEYTYPPYYPPTDVGNGYNGQQIYGYPDTTSSTTFPPPLQQPLPLQYGYQQPVTSTLYGYQPSITSWPYGLPPTTPTTTSMPMIIGWMPMTTPAPTTANTPPPSSTIPSMMAMIPMMPVQPTQPPATPPPPMPNYGLPPPPSMPMIPIYGYQSLPPAPIPMPPSSNSYGYQPPPPPVMDWPSPPSTPLPYGNEYTFNPPDNQHPHFDSGDHPPWFDKPHFANEDSNSDGPSDFMDSDSLQESQDMQDSRDNAISNILGPDGYELILTAIAFMAFGSYFMNMMLQLMQGNSPPTMMIVGNGGNNEATPVMSNDQMRKFSNHTYDDQRLLDEVLVSIEEFHNWLAENSTNIQ